MRFKFKDRDLQELYTEEKGVRKYPPAVVVNFFDVMAIIAAAVDTRDLYASKGYHFEKLQGGEGLRSVRLNKQYRLLLTFEVDSRGHYVLVIEISKHYAK